MTKTFLINSLLAAGFGGTDATQAALIRATITNVDDPTQAQQFQRFRQEHLFTLAQHRSHSSHSSHSSHRSSSGGHYSHSSHTSHYSSTGGYSSPSPAPLYTPPSTTAPRSSGSSGASSSGSLSSGYSAYSSPSTSSSSGTETSGTATLPSLSGRTALFKRIVMQVQVALMARGLFEGAIDGSVGPKTRAALRQFQSSHGLGNSGTITSETLDALHITTQVGE